MNARIRPKVLGISIGVVAVASLLAVPSARATLTYYIDE